jgi:hypothetical protein
MSKATNTVTFEWATTTNRKQGSSNASLSAYAADGTQNSDVDVRMQKWGTDVNGWVYLYTVYVNGVKRAAFAYADNGSIKLATMCKSPAAARRAARKFSERVAMGLIMDAQAETVEATEEPAQATINKVENGYELDMEDKIVVFLTAPLAPEGNIREIPNWKYREQYAIFDSEDAAGVEMLRYIQRYGIETVEEPAQAFAPGDAVIATYKGAQSRGIVVREYACPDHRKGYPDERFYSSPEDPVYVVKVRGKDREIAYRASHLERCLEAHA